MIAQAVEGLVLPPFLAVGIPWLVWLVIRGPVRVNYALWVGGSFGGVLGAFATVNWLALAVNVVSGLVAVVLWLRRGRRRGRAPRAYGAKSRARVAALVARACEAGRPRRVLRPVPGGVS